MIAAGRPVGEWVLFAVSALVVAGAVVALWRLELRERAERRQKTLDGMSVKWSKRDGSA